MEELFIVAKKWKQPKLPSTEERINKCGVSVQWNLMWQWKGTTYYNMEDPLKTLC